ncbi:TetR/AcrR family transcriptional regulator [Psychrobium sp. 1_MG-2023]|uniref:TetR/AcrR family transcriptional regulator n=1 Tax=Psychrobium sp. 1_MG-2023 TaxID=3062624 RepID=UPI000C34438D|nr:TetR/AcrR family transcriptional regulator [Psychrobium sp. 1_MG-2023]MDP2562323.1 TetR/AcrR family transcriptional regulator [Psychrobium sp. 1_MG-2023]PKF58067.1 TetR/AcrR family transcriptional regulator [Alteromonadales bacterium alter-6D02]
MSLSKKDKLLNSALVLFSEQGIHGTSTASIARHAGVANGTLFHHFTTKEELVLALYIAIKQELAEVLSSSHCTDTAIEAQAKALWNSALDWAIAQPKKLQFCQQVSSLQMLDRPTRELTMTQELSQIMQLINQGIEQNVLANLPLELIINHCHAQFFSTCQLFIDNESVQEDIHYRDSAFHLFWHALKAPKQHGK